MSTKTIAQLMREYLERDGALSRQGSYTGEDLLDVLSILDGSAKNFTVFYNAGGRPFHIWFVDKMNKASGMNNTPEQFEEWILKDKGHHYMYNIDGREVIIQNLP